MILIDALDELADDENRIEILNRVAQFHELYPLCQIILTSRTYSFTKTISELKRYETYRLSPINYQQAHKLVNALQKTNNLPAEKSKEILRRLQKVHGIELTPLLVTVFAAISDSARQEVPANITELFKKYTELMLGRWDATKGLSQQYHAPLKDFLLTQVAFEMHRRRTRSILVSEFESILNRELTSRGQQANVEQLTAEIYRSGVFRIAEDSLEFRHLLLQEFFAGRGIPSLDFLISVIAEEWWQRAIVFYFGEHPSDGKSLEAARQSLLLRPEEEIYQAAVTLGLALQATYLVELSDKVGVYRWVVEGLAGAKQNFLRTATDYGTTELRRFVFYYLLGRDSVALSVLESKLQEIITPWDQVGLTEEEKDERMFWIITGLIESGSMQLAEKLIKKFRPADGKLLLGLHFECFLIQHLHIGTPEQLKIARRITNRLAEPVRHLRGQLLKEVETELLELRDGELKALPESIEEESE